MPKRAIRLSRRKNGRRKKRESSCKRGYDRQWRKVRAEKIKIDPLCEDCLELDDRSSPTEDVHHIKKVCDFPELRLDIENLRSLCKRHHSIRTARGE